MPDTIYLLVLGLGFAAMAGAVVLVLLRPLIRLEAPRENAHIAFYRDQLDEIERDLARGQLAAEEAEDARTEVARRLLAADEQTNTVSSQPALRRYVIFALALIVPLAALGLYLAEGSPELRDHPFAPRVEGPADQLPLDALVYRVAQRLKEKPDDVTGWEVIAPAYSELNRHRDSAHAWARLIELDGPTAPRLSAMGEARVYAGKGEIGDEERRIFVQAEALDPLDARAQYYLGLSEIEEGRSDAAANRWQKLLSEGAHNAPWRPGVEAALARLAQTSRQPSDAARAILELDEQDRAGVIEGMVAGLAARLAQKPQDLDGWLQLVRSYDVLGRRSEAINTLDKARTVFASDEAALMQLQNAEKNLTSSPK